MTPKNRERTTAEEEGVICAPFQRGSRPPPEVWEDLSAGNEVMTAEQDVTGSRARVRTECPLLLERSYRHCR